MKVKITEIEFYLPKTIETLELLKNSNLEWNINLIEEKTGINKRFVTKNNETALDLGVKAANKISKEKLLQIDNLIYVTQSPEYALPTTACIIQHKLNLNNNVSCFDINQGCAGFVYALAVGGSMISNRISKKTLIICSDTYSKYIPKNDRTNRPIFSDGASAILIEAFLSFLGIGLDNDEITWGLLLSFARESTTSWWLAIFPGLAIFVTVTLFNLIGDGLTEALDSKTQ